MGDASEVNVILGAPGFRPAILSGSTHLCAIFPGSNFISTLAITSGWCSPALPANVYDRSNPFGPRTFISQLSFSREPTIDTRQSPNLSLRACSISARTSGSIAASPVLCSSITTAISIGCLGSVYRQDLGTLSLENQPSRVCVDGRVAAQSVHLSFTLEDQRRAAHELLRSQRVG